MFTWYRQQTNKTVVFVVLVVVTVLFFSFCRTVLYGMAPKGLSRLWNQARLMVVLSGSMNPALREGDIIVVIPKAGQGYEQGDIVSYKETSANKIITHRVLAVLREGKRTSYLTKGDANRWPDREPIEQDKVLGKVGLRIPYLGKAIHLAQNNDVN